MRNTKLEKRIKLDTKKMSLMNKSFNRGVLLLSTILFSVFLILNPTEVHANEVDVTTLGLEETTIITVTNNSEKNIKMLRIWLGENNDFKSFKTEEGWMGEKTPQGVIIFTSSETIKNGDSIKFGIKTDKVNPNINWKTLDQQNEVIQTGVVSSLTSYVLNKSPDIQVEKKYENSGISIFNDSVWRIIPETPNAGSTIRVVGENFGTLQKFEFNIDSQKIGDFTSDVNGNFITTMKIPSEIKNDRIELEVVAYDGKNKVKSIVLEDAKNRIPVSENIKMSINGIKNIAYRGDQLDISGMANPNTAVTVKITNSANEVINTRTAEVDSIGNWALSEVIILPYDLPFGKYSIVVSDGRNQSMKNWNVESDKIILMNPVKTMFEKGELMQFSGTVKPNNMLEVVLEDSLGTEVASDIIQVGESGFVEFEYQTTNDDVQGTWSLIVTQNNSKEFLYAGYGEAPTIPINFEFDKANYKTVDTAIIEFIGKPSENLRMIIISPSGNIQGDEIIINLREDGRASHELSLTGYASGIYSAVIQKGNSQTAETFSVGLQIGSGAIEANTIKPSYVPGDKILLIGNTNPNVLMTATLINPQGIDIKTIEIPSNSEGSFTEEKFRIPSDAIAGEWGINISSGSNLTTVTFEVKITIKDGVTISIGDKRSMAGYGENIEILLTATKKTSILVEVINPDNEIVDKLNCITKSDFSCQTLYTITDDMISGNYIFRAADSSDLENTSEATYFVE